MEARDRLGVAPLQTLFELLAEHEAGRTLPEESWRGLHLFGMDGSTFTVPDSEENLDKKWKPLLYPRPEPSLYSKPSNFWGQPIPTPDQVIERAQTSVVVYLPDLQAAPFALALKKAASRGLPVYLIAPRRAHMQPGNFLLSVALANAENPPRPLYYHFGTIRTTPFLLIDGQTGYNGTRLAFGQLDRALTRAEVAALGNAANTILGKSSPQKAQLLLKERYDLEY